MVTKSVTQVAGSFGWANARFAPAWGVQPDPVIAPVPNTRVDINTLAGRELLNDLNHIAADLLEARSAINFKRSVLKATEKYGYLEDAPRNTASAWAKQALFVHAHMEAFEGYRSAPGDGLAGLVGSLETSQRVWLQLLHRWRTDEPTLYGLVGDPGWLGPWELLRAWVDEGISERLSPRGMRQRVAERCLSYLFFGNYLARSRPHLNPDGFLYFVMPARGWSYYRLAVLWDAGDDALGVGRCTKCNRVFELKRSDNEYCRRACVSKAYRDRQRAASRVRSVCETQ